ncbi:MAG TPA: SgcJ/EcaC family oxidoreductase [Gemmatimonadales bacterium]|nr:SgcJ/EcaC family oxidoreductase [Gemmatimonadales bacterium]
MFDFARTGAFLAAGFLMGSGCAPDRGGASSAPPAELSETDRVGIRAADSAFMTAANAGDADAVAAVYTGNAMLLPPNAPPQRGQSAIRKFWDGFFQAYTVKFEIGSDTIEGRGDLAYNVGHYRFTAVPKARSEPGMADEGKFVEILRKQPDGSWKYVVDMYSSNLAPSR